MFFEKVHTQRCFELLKSDTESMYFAISRHSLDNWVPEHLKEEYFRARFHLLLAEACPEHKELYIEQRTAGQAWEKEKCCQKYNQIT